MNNASPAVYIDQAHKALQRNDKQEAIAYFQKALNLSPQDASIHNNIGVIHYKKGHYDDAKRHLQKASELNPNYFDSLFNLAKVFIKLKDKEQAVACLEDCLKLEPEDSKIKDLLYDLRADDTGKGVVRDYGPIPSKIDDDLLRAQTDQEYIDDLKDIKILHCPFEIAGNMNRISRMLRKLSVRATSVSYYSNWLNYQCDENLKINELPAEEATRTIDTFAVRAIEEFDIFHFHFNRSLYPDFRDLDILKQRGKKILFSFWGMDMRSPEWYFYNQAKFLGYAPPKPYFLNAELYHIHKLINRYADVMIGPVCIPRGLYISGMVDFAEWCMEKKKYYQKKSGFRKDPSKVYIVHAPTVSWKKGSPLIVRLLEACKDDVMPIEILYVSQVEPEKAKETYANADFAIDQVGNGTFSTFGLEMMGWGIPVLTYQNNLWDRIREYPPVIKITKQDFKKKIRECIDLKNSSGMSEFCERARVWAIHHTEYRIKGIPEYVRIYAALARGGSVPQHVNTSWYQQEYLMQNEVKSKFYQYMYENHVFDEIGIEVSGFDKKLYA